MIGPLGHGVGGMKLGAKEFKQQCTSRNSHHTSPHTLLAPRTIN